MDIEFIADNPRRKARPILEKVLESGVDQLAIACAFCTRAGIELLKSHTRRLRNTDSFVVVAAAPPTDYVGLASLDRLVSGHLFVHWGALAPTEIRNGAPLMHSKVYYARAGRECWLWTGSHNLTAQATQGGNCEAAVLLHGNADEKPFIDALRHLEACRDAAALYDPNATPPGGIQRTEVLAIHAEAASIPSLPLPWRVHLCLDSDQFDKQLAAPVDTRIFLYHPGTLGRGWQSATPFAAYSGSLTGVNFTALNRNARGAGTTAEWNTANLSIADNNGILSLGPAQPPGRLVTTQSVLCMDAASDPDELLFEEEPGIESVRIAGKQGFLDVDHDMLRFFQRKDIVYGMQVLDIPVIGRRQVVRVANSDARESDLERIRNQFGTAHQLEVEVAPLIDDARARRRHPFIVRAKYRLPKLS